MFMSSHFSHKKAQKAQNQQNGILSFFVPFVAKTFT